MPLPVRRPPRPSLDESHIATSPGSLLAGSLNWQCQGEDWVLFPQRALFWPRHQVLLVADLHLGKAASFRATGIPIPEGSDQDDLRRLSRLIDITKARELIILGDLIHNRQSLTDLVRHRFLQWRQSHPHLAVHLVRGNHDRPLASQWQTLGLDSFEDRLHRAPFLLQHHPEPDPQGYVLAGHLHPSARLSAAGAGRLTLPCFHFGEKYAVLPAFGSFTGKARIRPAPTDRIVVVAEDRVLEVPAALCR